MDSRQFKAPQSGLWQGDHGQEQGDEWGGAATSSSLGFLSPGGVASRPPPSSTNDKSHVTKPSAQGMKTIESVDAYGMDQRRPPMYGMFNSLYEDSDGSDGR